MLVINHRIRKNKKDFTGVIINLFMITLIVSIIFASFPDNPSKRELANMQLANEKLELELQRNALEKEVKEFERTMNELQTIEVVTNAMRLDSANEIALFVEQKERFKTLLLQLDETRSEIYKPYLENLEELSEYALDYSKYLDRIVMYRESDFTLREFVFLSTLCEKYNVPVDMMMAEIELESAFNSKAKNPSSTAGGYGQTLNSTARWLYQTLHLEEIYGEYTDETRFDKEINLILATYYISMLYEDGQSFRYAAMNYYGSNDHEANQNYADKIEKLLFAYGTSFNELDNRN